MKHLVHAIAGIAAMLIIGMFMASTLYAEIFASQTFIAMVKQAIVFPGLFILVPCLMVVGGSGFNLGKGRGGRLIQAKKKRMPFIAMNGILVLIPCAIILNHWAGQGHFGWPFFAVQALELAAGAVNLTLMSMNLKDGLRLSGRLHARATPVIR